MNSIEVHKIHESSTVRNHDEKSRSLNHLIRSCELNPRTTDHILRTLDSDMNCVEVHKLQESSTRRNHDGRSRSLEHFN